MHPQEPKANPPMLGPDRPLEPEEVRVLWSFIHGDIMIGGIREQLRRALGLCPRHTWAYFVTEVELWLYGPPPRGGHLPFDVGILYQDLLADVIGKITSAHSTSRHGLRSVLTPKAPCRICADLSGEMTNSLGYAGSRADELTIEAADLTHTRAWLLRTQEHWRERVCALCALPGSNGIGVSATQMCRSHLAQAASVSRQDVTSIASWLDDARRRMSRSVDSMTQGGQPATIADDAAVIETLGWFAGWQFPLEVTD
jgi:hypothetical protein